MTISKDKVLKNASTIDELRYFLAVCEEKQDDYTGYPLYFINNSSEEIEAMIVVSPGAFQYINTKGKMEDIKDDMIDGIGVKKYFRIPPKSYIRDTIYQDWDFDWSNQRYVWIKTRGKGKRLHFYMEKYFIAFNKKVSFIPVLNKSGWICL